MNPNGDVRVEGVALPSEGVDLRGDLYRPASQPAGDASPAVLVVGSWLTVKEQMAGRYAAGLAQRGLTALAFDFRGYGTSKGDPQNFESPERKIADIVSAVEYLKSRPDVDPSRIGALGICAGAGYIAVAGSRNPEIRSVAMVAPWLHDATLVQDIYGGPDGIRERMTLGEAARAKYESTGEVDYIPAASDTDERAVRLLPEHRPGGHPAVGQPVRRHELAGVADLRPHRGRPPVHGPHLHAAQPGRRRSGRRPSLPRGADGPQGTAVDNGYPV
jgi:hypothetical protein